MLFHKIEGAKAITHSRGIYKQVDVYHRCNMIYVAHGGGFIGAYDHGGTTHPNVRVDTFITDEGTVITPRPGPMGRLLYHRAHWTTPGAIQIGKVA